MLRSHIFQSILKDNNNYLLSNEYKVQHLLTPAPLFEVGGFNNYIEDLYESALVLSMDHLALFE